MKDTIYREDAIEVVEELNAISFYELNEHSKEAFVEIRRALKAIPSADRPKEKTISVDVLREILSDVKEAHRNNYEAEAVIADVWGEVVDMLKGADDEA